MDKNKWWTPEDGIGWSATHFVWGLAAGANLVLGVLFFLSPLLPSWPGVINLLNVGIALHFSMKATRPLFADPKFYEPNADQK